MKPAIKIILGIILVLAIAGGSFYGGSVYGKSQATAGFTARRQGAANTQFGQGAQGTTGQTRTSNMLFGTVKSVNDDGLVVTDSSGNTINVKVASTTLIEKNMSVKVTDLTEGETVIISGNRADDGTITARSLQAAPSGRMMAEGGAAPVTSGGAGGAQGMPQGGFQRGEMPPGDAPPAP
jgi:hypothetical protein